MILKYWFIAEFNTNSTDDELVWLSGTVLSYDMVTKEFCVVYDNEEDKYSFPLKTFVMEKSELCKPVMYSCKVSIATVNLEILL